MADYPSPPCTPIWAWCGSDRCGFVMADIPGLIGAPPRLLGVQFLRHLSRTRLLLHLVDVAPHSDSGDPLRDVEIILSNDQSTAPN